MQHVGEHVDPDRYRIPPGPPDTPDTPSASGPDRAVDLAAFPTSNPGPLEKAKGKKILRKLQERFAALQELLYANQDHALLVILQAMDTGGKDSAVRRVFSAVDPAGCHVTSFKSPSALELNHDYLWRVHQAIPARGQIGVFNRSHYEDITAVRVRHLVPEKRWRKRFDHINDFERMLRDEGVIILKFFLHISRDYQRQRLQRRLDRPDKLWKFEHADLAERARWDQYMAAYQEVLTRCSPAHAPWYVIPGEKRWYRDLLITAAIVGRLEALNMQFPVSDLDPTAIRIDP